MYVCVYTYTYTHTYIYVYIYIYMYKRTLSWNQHNSVPKSSYSTKWKLWPMASFLHTLGGLGSSIMMIYIDWSFDKKSKKVENIENKNVHTVDWRNPAPLLDIYTIFEFWIITHAYFDTPSLNPRPKSSNSSNNTGKTSET